MPRLTTALPIAAALILTGCFVDIGDFDDNRFHEDFRATHKLDAGGRFSLVGFNGKVEISTWDRNEVEVAYTKFASTRDRLNDIKVDVATPPGAVEVRAAHRGASRRKGGVTFTIRVPRKCELERVETTNGQIRIDDVEAARMNLFTSNGAVTALRTRGALSVETSNGSIDVPSHEGDARLKSSNGRIEAVVRNGNIEARTSNGKVWLRATGKASDKPMRAESNNGAIEVELDGERELLARTSNSSIRVTLPRDANADIRASTSHSSVSTDFSGLTKEENRLSGKIGKGGPLVDLQTSNGSISLRSR